MSGRRQQLVGLLMVAMGFAFVVGFTVADCMFDHPDTRVEP